MNVLMSKSYFNTKDKDGIKVIEEHNLIKSETNRNSIIKKKYITNKYQYNQYWLSTNLLHVCMV